MRPKVRFALKFVAFLVVFYALIAIAPVNDHVIVPFTAALTRVSVVLLRMVDQNVHAVGTRIASARFTMDVRNGCNAVETMMLFTAAVLSFPASARLRLIGLAIGLPVIQLANLIRLTTLFWVGSRHAQWFDVFHIAIWQSVIILIGVAMFAIWSSRSAAASTAHRR